MQVSPETLTSSLERLSEINPAQVENISKDFRTNQLGEMARVIAEEGGTADQMVLFNRGMAISASLDDFARTGKISQANQELLNSMDLTTLANTAETNEEAITRGIQAVRIKNGAVLPSPIPTCGGQPETS